MSKRRCNEASGPSKRLRIEEVVGKCDIPSDPDGSGVDSESSLDSEVMRQVIKKYKKKLAARESSSQCCRSLKREFQSFQRKIDEKLQNLEDLIQEVLRNQKQEPEQSFKQSPVFREASCASSITNYLSRTAEMSYSVHYPPEFPICSSDLLEQFDHDIGADEELRQSLIETLHPHAIYGHTKTNSSRVSYLLNYMFPRSLLSQYTFSGRRKQVEERRVQNHHRAFAEFTGIMGIIKAVINHKLPPEEEISNEELKAAVANALKRAWNNRHVKNPVYVTEVPNYKPNDSEIYNPNGSEIYEEF